MVKLVNLQPVSTSTESQLKNSKYHFEGTAHIEC